MEVPDYMVSTFKMLNESYPNGVPSGDLYPLCRILSESGMSNRSVAHALSLVTGGDGVDSYIVGDIEWNVQIDPGDIARVLDRLRKHGYDRWLAESA